MTLSGIMLNNPPSRLDQGEEGKPFWYYEQSLTDAEIKGPEDQVNSMIALHRREHAAAQGPRASSRPLALLGLSKLRLRKGGAKNPV